FPAGGTINAVASASDAENRPGREPRRPMVWPGNPLAKTFAELTRHDLNGGVSADKTGPTNPSKCPEYRAPSAEPDWTREGAIWSGARRYTTLRAMGNLPWSNSSLPTVPM